MTKISKGFLISGVVYVLIDPLIGLITTLLQSYSVNQMHSQNFLFDPMSSNILGFASVLVAAGYIAKAAALVSVVYWISRFIAFIETSKEIQ